MVFSLSTNKLRWCLQNKKKKKNQTVAVAFFVLPFSNGSASTSSTLHGTTVSEGAASWWRQRSGFPRIPSVANTYSDDEKAVAAAKTIENARTARWRRARRKSGDPPSRWWAPPPRARTKRPPPRANHCAPMPRPHPAPVRRGPRTPGPPPPPQTRARPRPRTTGASQWAAASRATPRGRGRAGAGARSCGSSPPGAGRRPRQSGRGGERE